VIILILWAWGMSNHRESAQAPLSPSLSADQGERTLIGRITGVVNCHWADPAAAAGDQSPVRLGQKYELTSGFIQISYDTGTTVIL
jgi:hypothetical protein